MTLIDLVSKPQFRVARETIRIIALATGLAVALYAVFTWPPECSTDPGPKIGDAMLIAGCPR
ncbi:hypothetical protein ACQR1Y_12500 [Bradyrhizobium sp. HKCCYLRH3099]|uniref:hypothetical protein n=1 Tax=Bradyrhizobium TaxID=374 RepID=UPI003EBD182A